MKLKTVQIGNSSRSIVKLSELNFVKLKSVKLCLETKRNYDAKERKKKTKEKETTTKKKPNA